MTNMERELSERFALILAKKDAEIERLKVVVEAAIDVDLRFGPHTNEHEQILRDALEQYDGYAYEKDK